MRILQLSDRSGCAEVSTARSCAGGSDPQALSACARIGEDFGYVHHADWFFLTADESIEVHQARHVARDDISRAGLLMVNRLTLTGSTLEGSNVDLGQEFTNMIIAQRGFEANAKVITTSDELLQDLVNLKR